MIVHPKINLWNILFSLKGSIAKRIAKRSFMITALASFIVLVEGAYPALFAHVNATPFTLLGISLSIFMSFRNNACYSRWWEGRQAWGEVITEVRSFTRASLFISDATLREMLLRELCGFTHALAAKLRHESEFPAAQIWLSQDAQKYGHNVSEGILRHISSHYFALSQSHQITGWHYMVLEERLQHLAQAQATCERIKSTPLPFPYTLLFHRTIYIFCLLLPFAMAEPLGWLAPIFTTIVSYTFLGLDALGDELEDPFGHEENDLPIDAMVRIIERDILDSLNIGELPPLLQPKNYVLS